MSPSFTREVIRMQNLPVIVLRLNLRKCHGCQVAEVAQRIVGQLNMPGGMGGRDFSSAKKVARSIRLPFSSR